MVLAPLAVLVATLNVLAAQSLIHSPPSIIKQPPTDEMLFQVAQTGENDKPFIIECEAEGEPTPRWILSQLYVKISTIQFPLEENLQNESPFNTIKLN